LESDREDTERKLEEAHKLLEIKAELKRKYILIANIIASSKTKVKKNKIVAPKLNSLKVLRECSKTVLWTKKDILKGFTAETMDIFFTEDELQKVINDGEVSVPANRLSNPVGNYKPVIAKEYKRKIFTTTNSVAL